jgi:hypothetical protein
MISGMVSQRASKAAKEESPLKSTNPVAAKNRSWEQLTPSRLVAPIRHLRNQFDTAEWRVSEITQNLCFAKLHPGRPSASTEDYKIAITHFWALLGTPTYSRFKETLRINTPPAVFLSFLEVYQAGVTFEIHRIFDELLKIALANRGTLKQDAVPWAGTQALLMIAKEQVAVTRWIKNVCDKQEYGVDQDVNEVMFWRTWRAPKLVHMQPSGNTPYDSATAWTREDEARTAQLLNGLSNRFTDSLKSDLDNLIGRAHVELAKSTAVGRQGKRLPALRYRVPIRRAIAYQLNLEPNASNLDLCRGLDREGVDVPKHWNGEQFVEFTRAYRDRQTRIKMEKTFNVVRRDMKQRGLLP